jgi:hypothetical protein
MWETAGSLGLERPWFRSFVAFSVSTAGPGNYRQR